MPEGFRGSIYTVSGKKVLFIFDSCISYKNDVALFSRHGVVPVTYKHFQNNITKTAEVSICA